jgi:hypothetical protein
MRTIVRYKLKPECVAENEALVKGVYAAVAREKPPGFHYATIKLADGVSFIHFSRLDEPGAKNPLFDLPAFKAFTADIKARCEEPPVSMAFDEIGAYEMFGSTLDG